MVGQRWALLVVRELLLGPKRFRDLLHGLDGMSPNVLSQRLKDLEAAGGVGRRSPAPRGVRAHRGRGAALDPVLVALGRWGRRRPLEQANGPMSSDALFLALRTTFDAAAAGDLAVEDRIPGRRGPGDAERCRPTIDHAPGWRIVEAGCGGRW